MTAQAVADREASGGLKFIPQVMREARSSTPKQKPRKGFFALGWRMTAQAVADREASGGLKSIPHAMRESRPTHKTKSASGLGLICPPRRANLYDNSMGHRASLLGQRSQLK
jgi:hypothetical protein